MNNAIDVPEDFDPGYELEEKCPCGYEVYEPSTLSIVEGFKPMDIEICVRCHRARMNYSVWHRNKGLI